MLNAKLTLKKNSTHLEFFINNSVQILDLILKTTQKIENNFTDYWAINLDFSFWICWKSFIPF
jgi:hypothetical protein